jgi:hypothetical protein
MKTVMRRIRVAPIVCAIVGATTLMTPLRAQTPNDLDELDFSELMALARQAIEPYIEATQPFRDQLRTLNADTGAGYAAAFPKLISVTDSEWAKVSGAHESISEPEEGGAGGDDCGTVNLDFAAKGSLEELKKQPFQLVVYYVRVAFIPEFLLENTIAADLREAHPDWTTEAIQLEAKELVHSILLEQAILRDKLTAEGMDHITNQTPGGWYPSISTWAAQFTNWADKMLHIKLYLCKKARQRTNRDPAGREIIHGGTPGAAPIQGDPGSTTSGGGGDGYIVKTTTTTTKNNGDGTTTTVTVVHH